MLVTWRTPCQTRLGVLHPYTTKRTPCQNIVWLFKEYEGHWFHTNWLPIGYQLTPNLILIESQSNIYWHPIWCQLSSNLLPIECQLTFCEITSILYNPYNLLNLDEPIRYQIGSKKPDWPRSKITRVPPLKIFWGTSRPMRSQHSELSTNEKPRFQPDLCWWQNMESTNPVTIGNWQHLSSN